MGDLDEWIRDQYETNHSIQLTAIVNLMKGISTTLYIYIAGCYFQSNIFVLANALKFLRSQSIVHRDLKPQNILLAQENGEFQPKLMYK